MTDRMKDRIRSSWVYPIKTGGDDRTHVTLIEGRGPSYNSAMRRFDPKQWVIDYNALMVATILPRGERSFHVPIQWRTNADFLGVRWQSKDNYNHVNFAYEENRDYSNMVLAFDSNPTEPDKFTVTIDSAGVSYTYRLAPYALSADGQYYECLDTEYPTHHIYPASVYKSGDADVPVAKVPYKNRTDYIFILDFEDLRSGHSFTGPKVDPTKITQISFDCVDATHGIGRDTFVADMVDLGDGTVRMELGGNSPAAKLTAGDKFQLIGRYRADGVETTVEQEFTVISWTGFGTGSLSVIVSGSLPGYFQGVDTFYGRYLQTGTPIGQINSTRYFSNLTMTGGRQTVGKRNYPQQPNGLSMTSGFDDGYNLTPERQVEMTHALGYRDWWTTYIGMSHYFNARTAFEDKITGEKVEGGGSLKMVVAYAGEGNASGHFLIGTRPDRGVDEIQRKLMQQFGVGLGSFEFVNGALGSSAADRAGAINPNATTNGLWWWDLEKDQPGPAFDNMLKVLGSRKPQAIIWAQGGQDANAIYAPGNRNPVPTGARFKLATQKIFAHMRSLWGANLPIFMQELGWNWGLADPTRPDLEMKPGIPTYLTAVRNSWGDVVLKWKSYKDDPTPYSYIVQVLHTNGSVLRTMTVPGTQVEGDYIYCDYPCELNVSDSVAQNGQPFPWDFLRFRVIRADNNQLLSPIWSGNVPVDDPAIVKKTALIGINSLGGGYFNDLSDRLNSGGSGRPGRKDVIAASTFRMALADTLGLRHCEVLPVMTVVGSSPINPMPYQAGFDPNNYWWNPTTNQPGPNLIYADNIVKGLTTIPDYFMESGPGETTGIAFAPESQHAAILAAWKTSNVAMLNWMRANWGNPNLEIAFQGASTSWWGSPPPQEVNGKGAQLLRESQEDMSLNYPGFYMASYVPDGNLYTTYRDEMADGLGWVHYSVEGYHRAAAEVGVSMALRRNMALTPPLWTTLRVVTGLDATKVAGGDIVATWTARAGVTKWKVQNLRLDNASLIKEVIVTTPTFTFTTAEQFNAYNQSAGGITLIVSEMVDEVVGPADQFTKYVGGGETLQPVTGMHSEQLINGDIFFKWDAPTPPEQVYFECLNVVNGTDILIQQLTAESQIVWTVADQIAVYGNKASSVKYRARHYRPDTEEISVFTEKTEVPTQVPVAVYPVTGFKVINTGIWGLSDLKAYWNPSPKAGAVFRVRYYSNLTNTVYREFTTTDTSWTFTEAEQRALYDGFTQSWITIDICEVDSGYLGPLFYYNAYIDQAFEVTNGIGTWIRPDPPDPEHPNLVTGIKCKWDANGNDLFDVKWYNVENGSIWKQWDKVTWTEFEVPYADFWTEYGYFTDNIRWTVVGYRIGDHAGSVVKDFQMTVPV